MRAGPIVILVVQRVPTIVTFVADTVNIADLIIQCVFVGPVMAGLLHSFTATHNWVLATSTVLLQIPLTCLFGFEWECSGCAFATSRLLIAQSRFVLVCNELLWFLSFNLNFNCRLGHAR